MNTSLLSTKEIIKSSFRFIKDNFVVLLKIFLPVQIVLFALNFALGFISNDSPSRMVVYLSYIILFFAFLRKFLMFYASKVLDENIQTLKLREFFREFISFAPRMLWAFVVYGLFWIGVSVFIGIIGLIGTLLPFFFLRVLVIFVPRLLEIIPLYTNALSVTVFCLALVFVLWSELCLVARTYGSLFEFIKKGRGIKESLALSLLQTRGRSMKVSGRFIALMFVALVPVLVLVAPLYAYYIIVSLKPALIAVAVGLPFVLPPMSFGFSLALSILSFVTVTLSLVIFSVAGFFLWRSIATSEGVIDDQSFDKENKKVKRAVFAGVVIGVFVVIGVALSVVFQPPQDPNTFDIYKFENTLPKQDF